MTDPYDLAATRLLPAKLDTIRHFWDAFASSADELNGIFSSKSGNVERVSEIMAPLAELSPDLMWEFGPSTKGHHLAVTAEWREDLRALARAVVNMAPDLECFEILDARTGNDAEHLEGNFDARFGYSISLSSIGCAAGRDNKVQMTATGPGAEEKTGNEVLALATYLLGEQVDRDWFGDVQTQKSQSGLLSRFRGNTPHTIDPKAFVQDFEATVAEIKAALPTIRACDVDLDSAERVLLKTAETQPIGRPDLFTFSACSEAYAQATLTTSRFSSVNHSAFGEWFLFLRLPRSPETPFDQVEQRYEIEDTVHQALSSARLGGAVAAGHGTDAVYVDAAMDQLDLGLSAISAALSDKPGFGDITVHFLDAGLPETGFSLSSFLSSRS